VHTGTCYLELKLVGQHSGVHVPTTPAICKPVEWCKGTHTHNPTHQAGSPLMRGEGGMGYGGRGGAGETREGVGGRAWLLWPVYELKFDTADETLTRQALCTASTSA
jgi:hypothetical protein